MTQPSNMRPCPCEGCQVLRQSHHLMCISHWRKVPRGDRNAVVRLWSIYRTTTDKDEKRLAYTAWLKAARKAIAWAEGARETKAS